eukprot:3752316-Rhodomonas_salina.1
MGGTGGAPPPMQGGMVVVVVHPRREGREREVYSRRVCMLLCRVKVKLCGVARLAMMIHV